MTPKSKSPVRLWLGYNKKQKPPNHNNNNKNGAGYRTPRCYHELTDISL
jgi:hypothetical protein